MPCLAAVADPWYCSTIAPVGVVPAMALALASVMAAPAIVAAAVARAAVAATP